MTNKQSHYCEPTAAATPLVEGAERRLEAVALEGRRGGRCLFSELNFGIGAGEALQVEGANGSGKTTLLRLLCGLSAPERGTVQWRGRDICDNRAEYMAELAYVGHRHAVKGTLTPIENLKITAALGARIGPVVPEVALARVGLSEYANVPCGTLSAGQQRRTALARLLLLAARLWVLDEPFTALDPQGRRAVERLIATHLSQGGMVVLTTHHAMDLGGSRLHTLRLG